MDFVEVLTKPHRKKLPMKHYKGIQIWKKWVICAAFKRCDIKNNSTIISRKM